MKRTGTLVAVALAVAAMSAAPVRAQAPTPGHPSPAPRTGRPGNQAPSRSGELECGNCHIGKHQGIVRMYVGMGGRGTPMIPSHMFQVRVECIACHTTSKADEAAAIVGAQTFRPSEQACLGCHGEKYRGLLTRWTTTLDRMRGIVAPKVVAARAALAETDARRAGRARAATLVEDADFNVKFVALAKGVHNVFYAADLLKLANAWTDDAMAALGKSPARTDDQLVRGGYCAVLCHEAAGVKPPATVTFERRAVPHVRHVSEFGATCTSCHSAETHKAVTATNATCTSCHHSAQNDRCETCHAAQSAFYRGQTKTAPAAITPNVMADAVGCTGCHDFGAKAWRTAMREKCTACHEPPYLALLTEWTTGFRADVTKTTAVVQAAEGAVARARRAGRRTAEADALLKDAREALGIVRTAKAAHNPLAADALLGAARQKADAATKAAR